VASFAGLEQFMTRVVAVSFLSALAVSVIFGVSIGAIYALVLPRFFPGPGWGTYWPLIVGITIATLIGGCIGYRVLRAERLVVKMAVGFCYGCVTVILVSYLSLVIILNSRGS
jgi:hypothetical protein